MALGLKGRGVWAQHFWFRIWGFRSRILRFALPVMPHKFGTCFWLGSAPTFLHIEFRPWFRILSPSLVIRVGPGVFCFWIASVAVIFEHEVFVVQGESGM